MDFCLRIKIDKKNVAIIVYFHWKIKKENLERNKREIGFIVSGFVVECHELVTYSIELEGFSGKINLDL